MIHVLISRYELSEYLFSDLEGIDTIFIPVKRHNPLWHRIVKALYYKVSSKFYSYYLDKDITYRLKNIPTDDTLVVIGEDTYNYWMLSHLCNHVKNKVAYFWNPCVSIQGQNVCRAIQKNKDKAKAIVEYIRSLGFRMATFDLSDAEIYNMEYYPQFYRSYSNVNSLNFDIKYDFFFCGRDKGRKNTIDYFEKRLSKFGTCKFMIANNIHKDVLSYFDYLKILKKTRVLCEIVQPGQSGLTIRALEAIFNNCKLITNNADIKRMDLYNKNNILLLDNKTTDEEIDNFLVSDYQKLNQNITSKYEVLTMLRHLSKIK